MELVLSLIFVGMYHAIISVAYKLSLFTYFSTHILVFAYFSVTNEFSSKHNFTWQIQFRFIWKDSIFTFFHSFLFLLQME